LAACSNEQIVPGHSRVFRYFDKRANDTIKFYGYTDFDSALYHARQENKNVLTVFSGWACMDVPGKEWKMLSVYPDRNIIQEKFILLWLPVDDKRRLKDSLPVSVFGREFYMRTVGELNYSRQLSLTGTNTQPTFCFLDKTGKVYGQKTGYTSDKEKVKAFIKSGSPK
jgi:hypothetical protein